MRETHTDVMVTAVAFDPFAGPALARVGPTTQSQAEIWTACQLVGHQASRAYNESISLRLSGHLDTAALEGALQALISRHEALRSTISPNGTHICVLQTLTIPFDYHDCSGQTPAELQTVVSDYVGQHTLHVFDLVRGPLLKAGLIRLAPTLHHLTITAHHLICDGWSMSVLLQDLGRLYSAHAGNRPPDLPEPVSFSEYAKEQLAFSESDGYRRIEQYWIDQFSSQIPVLSLPTDWRRPTVRTYRSNRLDFPLDSQLTAAVKKLGLQAGCRLVTTLLSAFEVLLHRLTGQDTIVVGLPTAGQPATGYIHLVGHCVHLLPLKSYLADDITFTDYLKQREAGLAEAYDHRSLWFGQLLQKINVGRDSSRVPLVPVVFNIDLSMLDGVTFEGLTCRLIRNASMCQNSELLLNISGSEKAPVLEWSYNVGLFKDTTITQMMADYEQVLNAVVRTPHVLIKDIHLDRPVRLAAVYKALNDTVRPYSEQTTLHQLINEQVQRTPDKIALVWGTTQVTYRDLNRRANQFAGYLLDNGVEPGGTVGVCVERTPDMVIALLAIMKCGAAYVPLDPSYPKERLAFMLSDSAATVLITSDRPTTIASVGVTILYVEELLTALPNLPDQEPNVPVLSTDLLYVLYTSGSTGKPKGVQITHHNLINLLLSMQEKPGISASDRLLAITTISFDIAGLELFLPLISGASLVLTDALTAKDGKALLQLIEQEQITFVQATPSTWRMLGDAGWVRKLPIKALCGGETLSRELAADLVAKCNSVWNVYGPTETTVWSSVKQISSTDGAITIGRPIANTQIYILDEYLRPVDVGTVGELFIGGKGVARGYLARPELTAERFLADPFANQTGVRMYRTGDLGKLLDNGDIQCLGRVDYQVKVRGYRIELGEIESALTALDTVRDVVVAVQVSPSGDERLIAYVVLAAGLSVELAQPYVSAWKETIKAQLPDYMVPTDFRLLTALPLMPNGKVDRHALSSIKIETPKLHKPRTEPRTSAEKIVADIWKHCLNLETVDVFENFFEIGGHSIIAIQVMARIKKETGKRLPLATLFEHSTIEKLALLLEMDGKSVTFDSLVPIKPLGSKVPLYIVHGAGLHVLLFNTLAKHMDPDQPVYGLQARGLNGVDEPLTTIEEIATYYINAITAKNPDGPYALAGYSFGGIIAYEMYKQFSAMGRMVTILAMFDTYAYQSDYYDSLLTKWFIRARFVIKRTLFSFKALRKAPQKVFRHNMHAIASRLAKLYWRIKDGEERQQARFSRHYYKLDSVNHEASLRYRLTPQPVVVDLFRAKENSHYIDDFEYLGWKPFALKGVHVHDVLGDHINMFSPPNDVEFARTLQKALDTRSSVRT